MMLPSDRTYQETEYNIPDGFLSHLFRHTDQQVKEYWADKYFDLLVPYSEFSYFT